MLVSELPVLLWYHCLLGRLSLIAMATSFGNRSRCSKAWMMVVTSNAATVSVAATHRITLKIFVSTLPTASEYLMVEIAAAVIGNV